MTAWIGVDPGGASTGLVVIHNGRLRARSTIERGSPQPKMRRGSTPAEGIIDTFYLHCILDELQDGLRLLASDRLDVERGGLNADWSSRLAIEDVRAPSVHVGGKVQVVNPVGIIGAGIVAGAVMSWAWEVGIDVDIIQPGGHADGYWIDYPKDLHDPMAPCRRGQSCGKGCVAKAGKWRHERAAWDAVQAAVRGA